jgi:hypothetical protein
MVKHEKICFKNPDNFTACLDKCEHLTRKEVAAHPAFEGLEFKRMITTFYCEARNNFLLTPQNEVISKFKLLSDNIEKMPIKCGDYKRKPIPF